VSQVKIAELEFRLEQSFRESLAGFLGGRFAGYRPRVALLKNGRKTRSDAADDNWSPETGEVRITFEAEPGTETAALADGLEILPAADPGGRDGLDDLVRQLDRAERRPGYNFVALKWFRDSVLPAVRSEWSSPEVRDRIVRAAIERQIVLTSKVPNPKSPEYPVTALRLNRSQQEVQAILGGQNCTPTEFQPVAIRGESISATILRERR
jgi:hypothetical protein